MNTLRKSIEPEKIRPYFSAWSELEVQIGSHFEKRDGKAEGCMNDGIALYRALLDQCRTGEESLAPLNNAERLAFIEAKPSNYAGFRQLQELFNEMQKKIASKRSMLD